MQNETCCPEEIEVLEETTETEIDFLLDKENRSQERYNICKQCPKFKPTLAICGHCNCFMKIKTRIYWAKCPISKW